ncbi:MAG: hypothetical protein ACREV5_10780 [Steroidobacter sp.]
MSIAIVTFVVLVLAASFGSWVLSQWLAARQRTPNAQLAFGGVTVALALGAVALSIIAASTWWRAFLPAMDVAAPLVTPATSTARASAPIEWPQSMRAVAPDSTADDWSATECVTSTRSNSGNLEHWFLDNECHAVVAIVFAACEHASERCNADAPTPAGWDYEPAGIVLISPQQRPVSERISADGPLIAATYAFREPERRSRRIRYLACEVAEPAFLSLLSETPARYESNRQERVTAAAAADACYSRVLELSRAGQRTGESLDALLRSGEL